MSIHLGKSLKTMRELRVLSLRQVEEGTGISNAYISQLESGKVKHPSIFMLRKLGVFYGVSVEELIAAFYPPVGQPRYLRSLPIGKTAVFKDVDISKEEEAELADYLLFIRVRNKRRKAQAMSDDEHATPAKEGTP